MENQDMTKRIAEIETAMSEAHFWDDKQKAQALVKELQDLKTAQKEAAEGGTAHKYDKGSAVMTIFSGAGGDDAEDFSAMLFKMYSRYFQKQGWQVRLLHTHENNHGGFRNITFEIDGKAVYGKLKNESGVHRLVRISPFNAKKLRHTSFSLVEVVPKFESINQSDIVLKDDEIQIEFARSSGPGGQNVNKRETAVRVVHLPTKIAVHVETERSQAQNKEKALAILKAKLYKRLEGDRKSKEQGMYVSKTTDIEWGNQIRSYVLHPYKMVKDHRTNVETAKVDDVLNGDIDQFISNAVY